MLFIDYISATPIVGMCYSVDTGVFYIQFKVLLASKTFYTKKVVKCIKTVYTNGKLS